MTSEPTTVFLIESSEETRALVAGFLDSSPLISVVGSGPDLSAAAVGVAELKPDVVVVDRFPGAELSRAGSCVVIHAATIPERTATEFQKAGICAIVFKEVGMLDQLPTPFFAPPTCVSGNRPGRRATSTPHHRPGPVGS